MKLKLDENLSRHLKPRLAALGFDALTAEDEGLLSQPDEVVAKAAASEGRLLLTLDVGVADLRKYPPGTHPGIVLFRPPTFGPSAISRFITGFLGDIDLNDLNDLRSCIVVVDPGRIRVRRPGP
jgi:predicted nuclease of predicted toxin-antitoxin system